MAYFMIKEKLKHKMFSPSVETSERQRRYTCMLNLIFKVNSRVRGARPSQAAGSSVIGERSNVNIKETGERFNRHVKE